MRASQEVGRRSIAHSRPVSVDPTPTIIMMVEHSTSSQNATAGFGIIADGPKTTITLTGSTVMGNIDGIGASNGGQLVSFQDNKVILNSTNGAPTSVASPE